MIFSGNTERDIDVVQEETRFVCMLESFLFVLINSDTLSVGMVLNIAFSYT